MRRWVAAVAAGLVLLMTTGCGSNAAPGGDALYAAGAERYDEFAGGLHSVLMAVHADTWSVRERDYGAAPTTCSGGEGYFFHAIREATPPNADADQLQSRAIQALEALDLDVTTQVFGAGDAEQRSVVATGGVFDRLTITIHPANGAVLVTASSACADGSAAELGDLVFAQSTARDQWRLLPATEGPDTVAQFYFPADGPLYYDEAGDPIDPQPVVTDPPVAPYVQ